MSAGLGRMPAVCIRTADHMWVAEQRARCELQFVHQVSALLLELGEAEARDLSDALMQLVSGTYGYCLDCHDSIPAERLDALAFAVRCKTCERVQRKSGADVDDVRSLAW